MSMIDEAIIRQRAHAIWEAQGKPDGQHLEHWEQARRELMNGSSTPYKPAVVARVAKAPLRKAPVRAASKKV